MMPSLPEPTFPTYRPLFGQHPKTPPGLLPVGTFNAFASKPLGTPISDQTAFSSPSPLKLTQANTPAFGALPTLPGPSQAFCASIFSRFLVPFMGFVIIEVLLSKFSKYIIGSPEEQKPQTPQPPPPPNEPPQWTPPPMTPPQ